MTTTTGTISKDSKDFLVWLTCAIAFTTLFFFLDEGYYNFNWTLSFGHWIVFIIYVMGLLFGQGITQAVILKKYNRRNKTLLTSLIGIPFGTILVFAFFYLI